MLTLTHARTFIYNDGPVEFEARDETGRPYLAGLVEYRDDGDLFIIVPTSEDEITAIAAGSTDARQLFLTNAATAWYLSEPYPGAGAFRAHRQSTPISEYTNDRDPGFSLMQAHEFTRADLPTAARSAAGKRHRFVADGQSSTTLVHYGQGDQDGDQQADRIQGTTRQGSAPDMRRGVVEL